MLKYSLLHVSNSGTLLAQEEEEGRKRRRRRIKGGGEPEEGWAVGHFESHHANAP